MSKNQPIKPGQTAQRDQIIGIQDSLVVPVSFETGEQGEFRVYFPQAVRIRRLVSRVVVALAATDAGTITPNNATGDMAAGTLTHAASAAFADEQIATPTSNQDIAAGGHLRLTTAKTTAGGEVQVTVEFERRA